MSNKHLYVQSMEATWKKSNSDFNFNTAEVHIWRANIPALITQLSYLEFLLETKEITKVRRYHQEEDRQTRIICKAVLRILLGRYLSVLPNEIRFQSDQNKKPFVENTVSGNIQFNVSHSGDWILIAIAENPIGIDLEKMNASFIYQNLFDLTCSLQEQKYIQDSNIPYHSFYKLWTRKEALLKATGKGLVNELSQVPSLDGTHQNPIQIIGSAESWQIISFMVDEQHVGSAAFMPVKTALQFLDFML